MAGTLGSLIVDISADVARLRKDMTRARRTVDRAMNSIRKSAGTAGRALGGIAAGLAAGLAGGGLRQAVADVAELANQSEKIGIAAEDLQVYRVAAQQVGQTSQAATLSIQRFSRRVAEAANGTGELAKTLDQYNISATDADGRIRDINDVLGDLADAIADAETGSEQLRIAFKAFDSEGAGFVNVLKDGREGLDQFREEARRAGLILDQALIERAEELDRRLTILAETISVRFKAAILTVAETIGNAFDPAPQFAFGAELEANRQRAEELAGQIERLEQSGRGVGRVGSGTLGRLRNELEALRALDPQTILAGFNAQIAEAAQRLADANRRNDNTARAAMRTLIAQRDEFLATLRQAAEQQRLLEQSTEAPSTRPPVETGGTTPEQQAQQLIDALNRQQVALRLTSEEMALYDASQLAAKVSSADLRAELLQTADAFLRASESAQEQQRLQAAAAQLRDSIRTPYDEAFDALDLYDELLEKNLITIDEWGEATTRALTEAGDALEELNKDGEKTGTLLEDVFEEVGDQIERSITDAVASASLSLESLGDLATSIFDSIARQIIQTRIASPIAEGIGGFIDGLFEGRAKGGPVRGGQTYLVGEGGEPELFTPNTSGYITPMSKLGGGGQVSVHFTVNSLDPATAASVLVENRSTIVGIIRGAFGRAGTSVRLA